LQPCLDSNLLSIAPKLQYDLDHMKTDPLSFLPASAFKTQEKAAGDLVFRQGDPTVGL
jgi:hypothetical protein